MQFLSQIVLKEESSHKIWRKGNLTMISHLAKFHSPNRHARCSLLILLLLTAISSRAQVDKATINGTVTDQSGAVISDVKITALNTETGVSYLGRSNNTGIYQILALPVGHYSVGFA